MAYISRDILVIEEYGDPLWIQIKYQRILWSYLDSNREDSMLICLDLYIGRSCGFLWIEETNMYYSFDYGYEFIALSSANEEADWLKIILLIFHYGAGQYRLWLYIMTIKQRFGQVVRVILDNQENYI